MRQVVLLRGINLGSRNRVSMPDLRKLLSEAGFQDVSTYLQSGNVVLASRVGPERLGRRCEKLLSENLGLDLDVIVRTRDELAAVVRRNPLGKVAKNPKRYQVVFLSEELDPGVIEKLTALAAPSERLVADGRELYCWHPEGIGRSRLWTRVAGKDLGLTATARNWTTVTELLKLASEP